MQFAVFCLFLLIGAVAAEPTCSSDRHLNDCGAHRNLLELHLREALRRQVSTELLRRDASRATAAGARVRGGEIHGASTKTAATNTSTRHSIALTAVCSTPLMSAGELWGVPRVRRRVAVSMPALWMHVFARDVRRVVLLPQHEHRSQPL